MRRLSEVAYMCVCNFRDLSKGIQEYGAKHMQYSMGKSMYLSYNVAVSDN